MPSSCETRGLDLGLAGETLAVTSLDLLRVIWNEKTGSWEEQGGEEGIGSGEQRAEEFLKLGNEEYSRDGGEEFLKNILKKLSINETVDSERRV